MQHARIARRNTGDALAAERRHRAERHVLVDAQLTERQEVQRAIHRERQNHIRIVARLQREKKRGAVLMEETLECQASAAEHRATSRHRRRGVERQ